MLLGTPYEKVGRREGRDGRTGEIRDVPGNNVVALAGLGQAGHDGIFKVRERQLAGAEKDGFVRDGDIEVGQQPVNGLFGL
jgi:hypothetical protein